MRTTYTLEQFRDAKGLPVFSSESEKIGKVEEVYFDSITGRPEWLGIGAGFFGTKHLVVPIETASVTEEGVTVSFTKDQVKDSPEVDVDEITLEREAELRTYYGLPMVDDRQTGYRLTRWTLVEPMPEGDWTQRRAS